MTAKKNKSKKNKKKVEEINDFKLDISSLSSESISITIIIISFVLFFSVYINDTFILTKVFSITTMFLFGFSSYIIPIVLMIIGSYCFVKKVTCQNQNIYFV